MTTEQDPPVEEDRKMVDFRAEKFRQIIKYSFYECENWFVTLVWKLIR